MISTLQVGLLVTLLGGAACRESSAPSGRSEKAAAGSASPSIAIPARLQAIVNAITPGLYECPDRFWPGLTLVYRSRAQILFTSRKIKSAFLFNDLSSESKARPVMTQVEISTVDDEWFASEYNRGRFRGLPTLGISLDHADVLNDRDYTVGRPDHAITTTVHEAFHHLSAQPSWALNAMERRTSYPEPWRPEFLRTAIVESLREAIRTPDGPGLGHAAFYFQELRDQFGGELASSRTLDVVEGTAEYATVMALALADVGCDATDAALGAAAKARMELLVNKPPYRDAYDPGLLAGLLLRSRGGDWTVEAARGIPPVELLLASTPAVRPGADDALVERVKNDVADRNAKRAPVIDDLIGRLESPDHVRVVVSGSSVQGTYGAEGHVRVIRGSGTITVYLKVRAIFVGAEGTIVQASGHTIAEGVENPCGIHRSWVLTVPASALTQAGGRFSAKTDSVAFERLTASPKVVGGLTWLCAAAP